MKSKRCPDCNREMEVRSELGGHVLTWKCWDCDVTWAIVTPLDSDDRTPPVPRKPRP